jgi:hypothetical protein
VLAVAVICIDLSRCGFGPRGPEINGSTRNRKVEKSPPVSTAARKGADLAQPFAVSTALKILDICQKIPTRTISREAGVKGSNPFFGYLLGQEVIFS